MADRQDASSKSSRDGISDDADLYEDLIEEGSTDLLDLQSKWLYSSGDEVFGPISAKALVEKLYEGELTGESKIAPEDGEFMALRRYGAFREHLPKVEQHHAAKAEVRAKERAAKRKQYKKRVALMVVAGVVGAAGFAGVFFVVQKQRAEKLAKEKEAELQKELEQLLASVTIEPPLIELVDDTPPEPQKGKTKRGRRRRPRKASAPKKPGGTGKLSRAEIMGGVSTVFGGIKRCIVNQMRKDKDSMPSRILLSFSIANTGRVTNVAIDDRFLRKSPMRDCMANKLGSVRFRAFKGEVRNVEYPITIGGSR